MINLLGKPGVQMLHCMAHARRYFKKAERSTHAMHAIQKLYELERQIKELTLEERLKIRQEKAMPILEELRLWMIEQYKTVTPKSPPGKLEYSVKRWNELSVYTTDGRLDR